MTILFVFALLDKGFVWRSYFDYIQNLLNCYYNNFFGFILSWTQGTQWIELSISFGVRKPLNYLQALILGYWMTFVITKTCVHPLQGICTLLLTQKSTSHQTTISSSICCLCDYDHSNINRFGLNDTFQCPWWCLPFHTLQYLYKHHDDDMYPSLSNSAPKYIIIYEGCIIHNYL